MGFASGLALVLLILVGYSSGTVLAGKGKQVVPGLLDLAVMVVLWGMALTTRAVLGKGLAILVWFIGGLVVGTELTGLRRGKYPDRKQRAPATVQDAGELRRWWKGWKTFTAEISNYQGRTLLAFFYFIVVTPFGILVRLFSDPLRLRRVGGSSFWVERQPLNQGIEEAREQF